MLGVDVTETALQRARAKAGERGIEAEFLAADALALQRLDRRFTTVLDSGLFHALDGDERREYVTGLAAVTEPAARMCCASATMDPDAGPHPVSADDLQVGLRFRSVMGAHDRIEQGVVTIHDDNGAPAWFATIKRI